jgi:multidrug efflux pump subunit AcrA (membrane-fusion protein)
VARPLRREIVEWDKYTGRLQAVENVEVRARVNGYLQEIRFKEGQIVEKDAPLFLIDPRPYQATLDQATARKAQGQARLDLARARVRRAKQALEKNAIATDDYDIIALLTTIVSLDPIHCYFDADERALLKYTRLARSGARPSSRDVANPVFVALVDETGFPHVGRMDFVDNRVDDDTGTITGRAIIPNPDGLLEPGIFVKIRLQGSGRYEATLIADEAIGSDQAEKFVYVVRSDNNTVERRKVRTGAKAGGLRVVLDGLDAQDRVIIRGLQRVRPGATVAPEVEELEFVPDPNEPPLELPASSEARRETSP